MIADREDALALRVAKLAALKAWDNIKQYYGGSFTIHQKKDGPATTADRVADRVISETLQAVFPKSEYGYLTEESKDGAQRLKRNRVFIIDPIDGTNDFIDQTGQFCIQIGLTRLYRGKHRISAALVYCPPQDKMYTALAGQGAFVESGDGSGKRKRLRVTRRKGPGKLNAVMSRSHISPELEQLIQALDVAEKVSMGSVGMKVVALAESKADFYVNIAIDKTKEWDSCAPDLILSEAGGRMSDLRGEDLPYNGKNVKHRYALMASNGASHDGLVAAIRAHYANPSSLAPKGLRSRLGLG